MAWRFSADASKVIQTGRNDTRRGKTRTVVQRARQSAGGKWEGVEGKKEAFQSPKSNDVPMTQSHGDVEQRRALVRNCKKTVEARRDSRHTSIFLDIPRLLDIARSSSIFLAGFLTGGHSCHFCKDAGVSYKCFLIGNVTARRTHITSWRKESEQYQYIFKEDKYKRSCMSKLDSRREAGGVLDGGYTVSFVGAVLVRGFKEYLYKSSGFIYLQKKHRMKEFETTAKENHTNTSMHRQQPQHALAVHLARALRTLQTPNKSFPTDFSRTSVMPASALLPVKKSQPLQSVSAALRGKKNQAHIHPRATPDHILRPPKGRKAAKHIGWICEEKSGIRFLDYLVERVVAEDIFTLD
ncbi:hypothetical protein B0H13DRAFT_2283282 [Mycena leptocephala]|nr:hypothetical protein B0H13DRAFT_2283282 [Mycena leptocephala]